MNHKHGFRIDWMPGMDRNTVAGFAYSATHIRGVCVQNTDRGPVIVNGSIVVWRAPSPPATTIEAFREIRTAIGPHIECYLLEFMPAFLVVADAHGLVVDAICRRAVRLREVIATVMWQKAFAGRADAMAACVSAGIAVPRTHRCALGAALCLTQGRVNKFAGAGEHLS